VISPPEHSRLPLLLLAALLGSGCLSTGSGDADLLDSRGQPVPPGEHLAGERYDDPARLATARTAVVVPFEVPPSVGFMAPRAIFQSAAAMAAEELTKVLLRDAGLDATGLGDGSEPAELVVRGQLLGYDPPLPGVRIQKVRLRCEVTDAEGGLVAVLVHRASHRKDKWEPDERALKRLCRAAGEELGVVLTQALRARVSD
jgi:hypothetical protein